VIVPSNIRRFGSHGADGAPAARLGGASGRGFTLVELLTVVVIIIMLVGILMPTISAVMNLAELANTKTRVTALNAGAYMFKNDTTFFPGQQYPGELMGTDTPDAARSSTGSQWLARALFTAKVGRYIANSDEDDFPQDPYANYKADMLYDWTPRQGQSGSIRRDTIRDTFAKPLPICYYVSRPGKAGSVNQFVAGDNSDYLSGEFTAKAGSPPQPVKLEDVIEHPTLGGPLKDGEFILIAAGSDRLYLSVDDVMN